MPLPKTMKAIGHRRNGPADDVLEEADVPVPTLSNPYDILVRVKAVRHVDSQNS